MKKQNARKSILIIPTAALLIIGLMGMFFRPINSIDMLRLVSENTAILIQIIGLCLFMAGLILIYFCINSIVKNDAELKISEEDERYNLIRGKAAQFSFMLNSYLLVALLMIFIITDYSLPAIMLGAVMLINVFVNMAAVTYYDKKM